MLFYKTDHLNLIEKNTFRIHLFYSILEGFVLGVLALNEFVFIKSLDGSNFELGVLFQFSVVVFTGLIFINEFLRRIKNKKKLLIITALVSRLPLFFLLFFPKSDVAVQANGIYHLFFLAIFFMYYLAAPVVLPNINLFLKKSYRHQNFSKLYSFATSINKIVMLIVTFAYGMLLDWNPYAYTYVFPIIAVLGIGSIHLLTKIPYQAIEQVEIKKTFLQSVRSSWRNMWTLMISNKPYLHFEMGFMLYGFAFMSTVAVITIYFDKALGLNYSSIAFYKNSYNIIAILLLPFFGRLLGRIDPRKFAAITFGSMMMFIFFLALTEYFPAHIEILNIKIYYMLLFYILFQSVFAATMSLLWFIGSAYFGKDSEAGELQAVHLSLTGVRALFAPLIGILFFELFGYTVSFGIAIALLLSAVLLMIWSYKRD
ncbi:MAG: MFS transporter [Bacteroidales bacterium]|nr:MFS transporter [Bacteroidales bacterium]